MWSTVTGSLIWMLVMGRMSSFAGYVLYLLLGLLFLIADGERAVLSSK